MQASMVKTSGGRVRSTSVVPGRVRAKIGRALKSMGRSDSSTMELAGAMYLCGTAELCVGIFLETLRCY